MFIFLSYEATTYTITSKTIRVTTVFNGEKLMPCPLTLSVILFASFGDNGSKGSCIPRV